MGMSKHQIRSALKAALDDVFSGDGEITVDELERAFMRQGIEIVDREGERKADEKEISKAMTAGARYLYDAIGPELVMRVRERWTDEPFDAIPVDDFVSAYEGLWDE